MPDCPATPDTSRTIRLLPETSDTGPSGQSTNFPDYPATTRFPAKAHSGDCARPFYEGENVLKKDEILDIICAIHARTLVKIEYDIK